MAPHGDPGDLRVPADTRPAGHGWSPSFLLLFSKHVLSSTAHQALLCPPGVHSTRPAWRPDPPRGHLGSRPRGCSWQRAPASGGPAQTTALLSRRGGLVGASSPKGHLMTAHDDKGESASLGANPGSPLAQGEAVPGSLGKPESRVLQPRRVHGPVSHELGTGTAKVTSIQRQGKYRLCSPSSLGKQRPGSSVPLGTCPQSERPGPCVKEGRHDSAMAEPQAVGV